MHSKYGVELVLDLHDCNPAVIRSKRKLQTYVNRLCKMLKMKKYKQTHLPYFGLKEPHTKGYSMLQFIETSSITGHFSEEWNRAYINIFSCKPYDTKRAREFTRKYFGAKFVENRVLHRA